MIGRVEQLKTTRQPLRAVGSRVVFGGTIPVAVKEKQMNKANFESFLKGLPQVDEELDQELEAFLKKLDPQHLLDVLTGDERIASLIRDQLVVYLAKWA